MVDGDIFREVEEELRREQFAKLWDKYGALILGVAMAIVFLVAGYKYWNYHQAEQAQKYGSRFTKALDLASSGETGLAKLSFSQIADEGPRGYAVLSTMRGASLKASNGKLAEAIGDYDTLSKDSSVDTVFREYSRIQAAMMRVDEADEAEMKKRLGTLANGTSSWRHLARELLGLSAYRAGNIEAAENYYNQVLGDRSAPGGIRQRAQMMLSLIIEASAENNKQVKTSKKAPKTDQIPLKTDKKAVNK